MAESGVVLADHLARRRISAELDATLFVEAGAGTGKTSELVARLIGLLRSGRARMSSIAAITFTEAAASELRARVHDELVGICEREAVAWAAGALEELDESAMTTIHGFTQRILAEHPLEAGLPLRFRVLDEIESSIEFERRFAQLLETLVLEPGDPALIGAVLACGISIADLRALAVQLDERRGIDDRAQGRGPSPTTWQLDVSELGDRIGRGTEELCSALDGVLAFATCCDDPADRLHALLETMRRERAELELAADWIDQLAWISGLSEWKPGGKGTKNAWSPVDVGDVRDALREVEAVREELASSLRGAVLGALVHWLESESARAAEARARTGELRFHDLLVLALALLDSKSHIRRALQRRYSHILVDEFQDTDPLQLDIVRLLACDPDDGSPVAGKLFFVGDPRQSIYRFRGADPELYRRALDELISEEPERLVTNFRSVPGVLDWINGVFSSLFADLDEHRGAVHGYVPLVAARAARTTRAAVVVLGGPSPERPRADERRALEAGEIVNAIDAGLAGGWLVETGDGPRPARAGDVAILVPRRTGLAFLEEALDAHDIAYRVGSTTLVYGSSEVREVLACVRAVNAPSDEPAVIAALRTSLVGCSDDDLLSYRRSGGAWRLDAAPPVLDAHGGGPVVVGLARLRSIHDRRHRLGIAGTLEAIVEELRVLELAACRRHPREALRRVGFVLGQARAFSEAGGRSLSDLLAWMELQAERNTRVAEEPESGDGEDAVRILTIHGAKGLEFPVVVLAGLGASPRLGPRGPRLLQGADGLLEARVRAGLETAGFADLACAEERRDEAERIRLCYVAATRARDHLLLALHHCPAATPSAASLAQRLFDQLDAVAPFWRRAEPLAGVPVSLGPRPGTRAFEHDAPAATPEGFDTWIERRGELLEKIARRQVFAATELVAHGPSQHGPAGAFDSGGGEDPKDAGLASFGAGRGATALGRAVHGVLQRIDLATGAGLFELVAHQAEAEGCAARVEEVAELVASALASPVVVSAARVPTLHRELPLSVPVGRALLEGVVDLCFETSEGLVVVDYKTELLESSAELDLACSRYRPQAGAYALALEQILTRRVHRFVLLFLGPAGGAAEIDVDDLDGAVDEARRALSDAILAGSPSPPD